ncbi:MAG: CHRD domain-containing protein [Flavobacterium sp.]|nr:CHRD domain-containing protein [Flavobacterium sp.]
MKHLIRISAFFILLTGVVSCTNNDNPTPNPNVIFKATLNGASEVPTNASTATGMATLTFNTTTKMFTITVTHDVASPTNGHIHKGAIGVSGPPVFPFTSYTSPITYTTSVALDATQQADLYAELYYVNIHSATFPGGEIRGQLLKQAASGSSGGGGY